MICRQRFVVCSFTSSSGFSSTKSIDLTRFVDNISIHEVINSSGITSSHTRSRARSETGVYAIHVYAEMHVADLPFLQFPLDILSYEADAFQMDRLHRIDTQLLPLDQIPLASSRLRVPTKNTFCGFTLFPGA